MRFRAAYAGGGSRPGPDAAWGLDRRRHARRRLFITLRYRRALLDPDGPRRSGASTGTCCCTPTASRRPARPSSTPRGNRTPATGVKGPRANRYTMGAGGLSLGEGAARPADARAVAAGALGVVHRDVGAREDVLVGRGVGVEI